MKHILIPAILLSAVAASAQTPSDAVFDFNNPASLTPALTEPAVKDWVDLDGRTFTDGTAEISFTASSSGNTHVRLFHPYDGPCDVRIYDGETLTARSTDASLLLREIRFEMSVSGAATGSADINFSPSCGSFDWAAETWTAPAGGVAEVSLTSVRQSRLARMTVSFEPNPAGACFPVVEDKAGEAVFYTIDGVRLAHAPENRGVYIRIQGGSARRVLVR
ncbi:MAG: hypothetical protein K2L16_08700 [Muribaculaceae bacterium]|nr:hypothetical protein [Muribaculaceae bacterium]